MWCLSQDKDKITNGTVSYFIELIKLKIENKVSYEYGIYFKNEISSNEIYIKLASYSSLEKARKVMNMLKNFINENNYSYHRTSMGEIITQKQNVFQFPTDEEVKI